MVTVSAGARITGSLGFEEFGAGLAIGDFNGDGAADLAINHRVIGSSRNDSSSTIQIIFGGDGVLEGELEAALLAGGEVTTSGVFDIGVGIDVAGPISFSDVNDDGFDDLLIGAPRARFNDPATGGTGYVLFGRANATFDLGVANLTNGVDGQAFFVDGGRNAGSAIIDLGDVDGDGDAEFFVSAPFSPAPDGSVSSGLGFVFDRGSNAVTDLSGAFDEPAAPDATVIFSSERAFIAEDAAALGDVNGDGLADFLLTGAGAIGAASQLFGRNSGEAYLIYGQNGGLPDEIDVARLDGQVGTKILATDVFAVGNQVASAGDVNGDGLDDFILIDAGPATDEPAFYLVYGQNGGFGAEFDLSTSDGVSKLGGVASVSVASGVDMASVGDVNGDGFDDILVSRAAGGSNGGGEVALLFGSASGLGDNVDLDAIPLGAGYRFIAGPDDFRAGFAVAGGGDVNADGVADFIIGSPFYNPPSNAEFEFDAPGSTYLVYGGAERLAALDALDGEDGLIALANVVRDIEIEGAAEPVAYSLGADVTIAERNGQDTTFAVTVARTSSEGAAEIALAISGEATIASGDIAQVGGSTTFADGETETTVIFRVTDDALAEATEQAIFDLSIVSSDVPGVVADGQLIATIEDDDAPAVFDLGADFTVAERNGEDVTFAINVTRSNGFGVAEVALTPSGSADASGAGADFVQIGGSGFFDAGETETSILFRVVDDLAVEFAEEAIFDLSFVGAEAPSVIGDGRQVVTITDDDEISFFSLGQDFSIAERNGQDTTFAVTVTRTFAEGEAQVALTPSGSAEAFSVNADFVQIGGSSFFADGETETSIIFRVVDDLAVEFAEEAIFDLSIVSSDAAAEVADGRQVVTIQDDDEISFFSLGQDFTVTERNGQDVNFAVTVTRTFAEGEAEIALATSGSGAADAFQLIGSTTFADGETETQVIFQLVDDLQVEFAEEFILDLSVVSSDAASEVADGRQVVTIQDDDEISFFSLGDDFSIAERNGQDTTFAVTVTRTFAEGAAEVALATSGSGAADAFLFLGDATFADGETETQLLFRLIDDQVIEPTEEFILDLSIVSSDAAAEVADGRQVVSILDDDTPVVFSIDPDVSFTEGTGRDSEFTTFVERSSGVGEAVVNLTLGGTATGFGPNRDYELLDTSVTFADGETLKAVRVRLVADAIDEADETISLGLNVVSSVGVAVVEDGTQIITIEDDDATAFFNISAPAQVIEGSSVSREFTATITRSDGFGEAVVDISTGGTASSTGLFRDFELLDPTVAFADGELSKDVRVRLIGDVVDEPDETLTLGIDVVSADAGSVVVQTGQAVVTILDDDEAAIIGTDEDDVIAGGTGADRIFGEDGDDRIFGGAGDDFLNGGVGRDSVFAGSGDDTVQGGGGPDLIFGGSGDDSLLGEDGTDIIRGGFGDDSIAGGFSDDSLSGGFGDDEITGGEGDDIVTGGAGDDTLSGDDGDDRVTGGSGDNQIFGGVGADTLSAGFGDDLIRGGVGDDAVFGGGGSDVLTGDAGDDRISGSAGDDFIFGGSGADTLSGGTGDDNVVGGVGDDRIVGRLGDDSLFGGEGADELFGGSGDDSLAGDDGEDELFGGSGDDELEGGDGDDQIIGGRGEDVLNGGLGDDELDGGRDDDSLFGAEGDDELSGGFGDDLLQGGSGRDELSGDSGDDALNGEDGNDLLFGGAGDDSLFGGEGIDSLRGGRGDDEIIGGEGRDILRGDAGDDVLFGGFGDDLIQGGQGDDTIFGNTGSDVLFGDAGLDVFVFFESSGSDLIADFQNFRDKIEIRSGAESFSDLQITADGASAVIAFGSVEIELERTRVSELDASDFIF
ncbi:MAG: Calx-beta domain-containing protein [Pseudomonadota bacterium]